MATMLRPKASAIASSLIAVAPVAIPPTTIVPHPMNTKANVPMNSAIAFFIICLLNCDSDESAVSQTTVRPSSLHFGRSGAQFKFDGCLKAQWQKMGTHILDAGGGSDGRVIDSIGCG